MHTWISHTWINDIDRNSILQTMCLTKRCRLIRENYRKLHHLLIAEYITSSSSATRFISKSLLCWQTMSIQSQTSPRSHFFLYSIQHCGSPQSLFDLEELWFFLLVLPHFLHLPRHEHIVTYGAYVHKYIQAPFSQEIYSCGMWLNVFTWVEFTYLYCFRVITF